MSRSHFSKYICLAMAGAVVLSVLILCFYGSSAFSDSKFDPGTDQSTLQLLHVVFRHGPRTPADTYPNDPHSNHTFLPYGWGQITNDGKRELFKVGAWMRKRYGSFLGPYYHPDVVHAQSTGVTRTYMSLATVLASLFPPKNTPMEWNSKYNWQPIPILSQPLNEDTLLLVRTPCPRYYEALGEVMLRPEVRAEVAMNQLMLDELSNLTGMNIYEPEDVQSLYLTLQAEQEFGLKLPDWTKEYFPNKMQFLAEQSYVYNVYTPEMQKIKAGPFLKKMLMEMEEKLNNKLKPDGRKLFIYTGHDSTIVNILSAVHVWSRQMPLYSAMAIFELHKSKDTGAHHVEIYFRTDSSAPAGKLTIPGCDFQCPLDKLIELTSAVIPTEKDVNRCDSLNVDFTEPPPRGP